MPETLSTRAESMPGGPATGKRDSAVGGRPLGREDGAGVRSRPLAAGHELLAADEDVLDAIGARDVAGRAAREIPHLLRRARRDPRRIEADDVGHPPWRQEPALRDAVDRRRHGGEPAERLLPAEEAALAHPVAEEVSRVAGVAENRDVRARVGERDQALGAAEQHAHVVLVVVHEQHREARAQVLGGGEGEERVDRVPAARGGDLGERAADERRVLGPRSLLEDDVAPAPARGGIRPPEGFGLHRGAEVGVGEEREPRGVGWRRAPAAPAWHGVERRTARREVEVEAHRPARHLRVDGGAGGEAVPELRVDRLPDAATVGDVEDRAEAHRPPRGAREPLEPGELVGRRSEEHTSELQSLAYLVCRLLLEKKKKTHILYDSHALSGNTHA